MSNQFKPLSGLLRTSIAEIVLGGLLLSLTLVESRIAFSAVLQLLAGILGVTYRNTGKFKVVAIILHLIMVIDWSIAMALFFAPNIHTRDGVAAWFALAVFAGLPCSLAGLWFVVSTRKADVTVPVDVE